jgi:hypothetical protein
MKSVQETDIDLNYVRDGQSVSDGDFAKYWGGVGRGGGEGGYHHGRG